MPGTPEEYMQSEDFTRAESLIDEQIQAGTATGASILSALQGAGMRIYGEGAVDPADELPMEDVIPEEMEEEPPMETEALMDEELEGMGPGPSMIGGPEGGRRGALIEAVQFGMTEDSKNKKKKQAEREEY